MAIPVWPSSLPQALIMDGYGQQAPNTIIATQMDVGPGKRRRRTSAGVQPVQGQIVVTEAQLAILRAFFRTDLGDGALRFRWIDPVSSPNPAGDARMVLDGSTGTYASTPHSAAVDITGDLALVARIAPEAWDAGDRQTIIAKREASAHSFQWRLEDGVPRGMFWYGPENQDFNGYTSPDFAKADGEPKWLACTLSFDAGTATIRHFVADDGTSWILTGEASFAQDELASTTAAVEVGSWRGGGDLLFNGNIFLAQIYSGAGFNPNSGPTGTLVADFNPSDAPRSLSGGGNFTSSATGEVWTLHGSASIHNPTVGVPVEMRFTEPPQWSARTSGIYTVSLALEILP